MAAVDSALGSHAAEAGPREMRKVVVSAALGQFVEWYDFVVYAYSATMLAKLFFPNSDPVAALLSTFAVYAVGFVMRLFGGYVFGRLGDRYGRKSTLAAIILLMGVSTVGIGLLPTYAQIGVWAPVLLVLCRLLQGLSAAGEATGSNSFVAEHAPQGKRGIAVAFTYSFANVGPIVAALVVLAVTSSLGPEKYGEWGWRIPFLLGAPLALVGIYIRAKVGESPAFEATKAARRGPAEPFFTTLKQHRAGVVFTFVLSALSSLGFYTLAGYFVTYLVTTTKLGAHDALISNCIALVLAFLSMNLGGYLSDRYGRKPVLVGALLLSIVTLVPGYMLAANGTLGHAILGQGLIAIAGGLFWGPLPIALLELFPTRVRLSCASISVNAAYALFGGTAPFLSTYLLGVTHDNLAPAYYAVAVFLLAVPFIVRMPETYQRPMLQEGDLH